ncbi:hypothetical protein [Leptothoe spongobia]|uniref:Uncharacterized protein n=1 Tax=Leptothoe spongobia TAU-MAC 1115 TaxID=1967444 RepID=A0A947DEG0_9CYAN|nr:hypothetical protein [Leptothoe spongobia]MBT9315139.1 hypothetical protein [Leptothoe spongobia TAU-MAC 1115]
MNKFILGGILAAISLMAIYGTSASDQVISRVDGTDRGSSQPNFGQAKPTTDKSVLAINTTETTETTGTENNPFTEVSARTPLEKAGTFPQRQTIGANPNFGTTTNTTGGDDTDGGVVEAPAPTTQPPTTTGGNATTTPPATTTPAQTPEPIRALW